MKPKKLNWRNGRAETPFGAYRIIEQSARGKPAFVVEYENERAIPAHFRKPEDAQAAAQADFERRVKQCFEGNDENESLHTDGLTESDLIGGDN